MKKPKKVYDPRMPRFGSGEEALVDAAYMERHEKRIKEITDELAAQPAVVKLEDGREMTIGAVDSAGNLGWVFKDTLKPVTDEDVKRTPQMADDLEDLIEKAIDGNMTITDPNLYEAVYSVASTVADALTDILDKDVRVMNEAQIVLQAIKDTDPGVYDEMIDNVLRLISEALNLK